MSDKTKPRLVVVIVVPHYWGKGETVRDAWKRVSEESGQTPNQLRKKAYRVNVVPETDDFKAYVDEMGSLHWANVDGMRNLVIDAKE